MTDDIYDNNDCHAITLFLTSEQLCKAASLGGYFVRLQDADTHAGLMAVDTITRLQTKAFAKVGIEKTIAPAYELQFPLRYPDDVENTSPNFWSMGTSEVSYQFRAPWKGKVSW